MARYAHPLVLDNGPAYIQANCNKIALISAYTFGDSYATLTNPANVVASAAMTTADFTFTDSGLDRVFNNASKTDAGADASGNPTHFAFLDTANSRILRVTEENTANAVAAGGSLYTAVTGDISVGDLFGNALQDYILYRCHAENTQYAQPARAQAHYAAFGNALGVELKATVALGAASDQMPTQQA